MSLFKPLWLSGAWIYLIHLKAEQLRSNNSEADDLSLRIPKSNSPYLVLLPSADGNCMNVSSSRLCCKTFLSLFQCLPSPCTLKIEPQFIQLHVNGLILKCDMWYIHLEEKVVDIFPINTYDRISLKKLPAVQKSRRCRWQEKRVKKHNELCNRK